MAERPQSELDAALMLLESRIVHTERGSFVSVDDLKEAIHRKRDEALAHAMRPKPRTFAQARRMVYRDEELMGMFDYDRTAPPAYSPSVAAIETQSPSRA
jgi:sugar lactone lactonase YvrE